MSKDINKYFTTDFKKRAGLDALMIGLFTPADNLHAPDESFHIDLMNRAIEVFEKLFNEFACST